MYGGVVYGGFLYGGIETVTSPIDFINDLRQRRGRVSVGGNPTNFMELVGAESIFKSFYEPDPITFRDNYYYNTRNNELFVIQKSINSLTKQTYIYWKKI